MFAVSLHMHRRNALALVRKCAFSASSCVAVLGKHSSLCQQDVRQQDCVQSIQLERRRQRPSRLVVGMLVLRRWDLNVCAGAPVRDFAGGQGSIRCMTHVSCRRITS